MMHSTSDLHGYAVRANDGFVGHVRDLSCSDSDWVVRYLVVETGPWLSGRMVLISPLAFGCLEADRNELEAGLSKELLRSSPPVDVAQPLSRRNERQMQLHYGYPCYWEASGPEAGDQGADGVADDCRVRNCAVLINDDVQGIDGDVGRVNSLLLDDATWAIRYVVVETGSWWPGHRALLAVQWVVNVDSAGHAITVDVTRQSVLEAPPYISAPALDRCVEADLHRHHRRDGYWVDKATRNIHSRQGPGWSLGSAANP